MDRGSNGGRWILAHRRVGSAMNATIVSGASRGLGLGIAHRLAASGHTVVMAARDTAALEAAAREVGGIAVPADVTSPDDVQRLVATTLDRCGGIDALVNNAATEVVLDPLETLTAERFRRGFDVDVVGTLLTTQAVLPHLRAGGAVVNLISARGGNAGAGPAHLSVGPCAAAHFALTRNLAVILAPRGIAVHALLPGLSLDGDTGRKAVPALGVDPSTVTLTAAAVGDAVVELLGRDASSVLAFEPDGRLVEQA